MNNMSNEAWEELRAICNTKWEKTLDADKLAGTWAEDGSTYTIKCPEQLLPILQTLQHTLCDILQARDKYTLAAKQQENTLRLLYTNDQNNG